jgi:hypothetical protein
MGKESAAAMKTESKTVRVIPYGRLIERMPGFVTQEHRHRVRVTKTWKRIIETHELWQLLIAFSDEVDERFVQAFREKATPETKILLLNESRFSDWLVTRIIDLPIRSAHRFYIVDSAPELGGERKWQDLLRSFLGRLSAFLESDNARILDANIEDGILRVISPDFQRLQIPVSKIEQLANANEKAIQRFEIDDDGAYLYWSDLDLHLGWEQLMQIVDPDAVHRAKQKSHEFNLRYGAAIRKVREKSGVAMTGVAGLSDKQLRRIEIGECRLTSNGARALAKAHGITPNEYLQKVAEALE